jgi:transposase-like protein
MTVMSLRLNEEERKKIATLASQEKKEKSTTARELINAGWTYRWLMEYHRGRISLGKTAERLRVSMSDVLDMLAELGIQNPLRYDEYLEGFQNLK